MKTNLLICTAVFALTLSSFSASAQMQRPERPEGRPMPAEQMMLTPRQRAEQRTNEMDKALGLDDKQYKKINKIFLKEENAKEASMENGGPMGPPPGGMGGGPSAPSFPLPAAVQDNACSDDHRHECGDFTGIYIQPRTGRQEGAGEQEASSSVTRAISVAKGSRP